MRFIRRVIDKIRTIGTAGDRERKCLSERGILIFEHTSDVYSFAFL